MRQSCWCANPADEPILLMRWSCWCADPANAPILLRSSLLCLLWEKRENSFCIFYKVLSFLLLNLTHRLGLVQNTEEGWEIYFLTKVRSFTESASHSKIWSSPKTVFTFLWGMRSFGGEETHSREGSLGEEWREVNKHKWSGSLLVKKKTSVSS